MEGKNEPRRIHLQTVDTALKDPLPEIEYLIDGLLTHEGISIIAADPKTGKSTFMRNMLASLADGHQFLGRKCQQCKTALLQLEGGYNDTLRHFAKLQLENPANILVMTERVMPQGQNEALSMLRQVLEEHHPRVMVIDTLAKFLSVADSNDNDIVNAVCAKVETMARDFAVHIIGIMHTKKRRSLDTSLAQAVLGATAWRAACEVTILLDKKMDGRRTFQAELRVGREIEEHFLTFDPERHEVGLGITVEFERQNKQATKKQSSEERIRTGFLNRLAASPIGVIHQDLLSSCEGKQETKLSILSQLIEAGQVRMMGDGVRGNPKTYMLFIPEPMEVI